MLGHNEKMTNKTNLKNFPFLRFKTLWIIYSKGSTSIDEKLQLLQDQLQLFKTALSDVKKIALSAGINQNDQSQFRDHSQLLAHFREQVLPICDSSLVYNYSVFIDFKSNNDAAGNVIGQILQLPSINRCQEVYLHYDNETFIQLPVDAIANWLNRNSDDGIGGIGQGKKRRFLAMNNQIKMHWKCVIA